MKLPKFMLVCATAACLGAYSTTPAKAAVITINNYSFENATGYWAENSPVSSWGHNGSNLTTGGSYNISVGPIIASVGPPIVNFTGADGSNMLFVHADPGSTGTVTGTAWVGSNSLGTYAANTVYSLTVAVATPQTYATTLSSIIALGTDGTNPGSALASKTTNFGSLSNSAFQDITLTLDTSVITSAVGQNIVVLLEQNVTTGSYYGKDVLYDNVRLNTLAVPEPATWALLAFSLTTVMVLRRRRNS